MREVLVTGLDLYEHEKRFKYAFLTAVGSTVAVLFLMFTSAPSGQGGGSSPSVFANQQPAAPPSPFATGVAPAAPKIPPFQPTITGPGISPGGPMMSGPGKLTPSIPLPTVVTRGGAPSSATPSATPQSTAPKAPTPPVIKPIEDF